ncbi:hypothetical protein, partial [Rossellomorea marisflavi]|uniref:hypothetical protein n=1 Tax=Rossellomorea marisflavi TaxID=189381 RepID=UPI003D2EA0E4
AEKEEWRDPAGTRRLAALPAGKQAPAAERNGPCPNHTSIENKIPTTPSYLNESALSFLE